MVREDLIEGAVSFLQDPSVASAPVEQRIAFLRSKNLTKEEIDVSLARVGQATPSQAATSTAPYQYRVPSTYQQSPQYWSQTPPIARRDWRDYFIAATALGGLGYGIYWTAKRYVYPLIAPPTPAQLEQDKASIDASFEKAFALLDQLATDTTDLKNAEKARTERLDNALAEVEKITTRIKESSEHQETERKRSAREMLEIRDQIPRAIEKEREHTDEKLKELITEMKSLKTLVANRMSGASSFQPARTNGDSVPSPLAVNGTSGAANGLSASALPVVENEKPSSILPDRTTNGGSHSGRGMGGTRSPSIPAWQLAAKKRSEEPKKDGANGSSVSNESGTLESETTVQ